MADSMPSSPMGAAPKVGNTKMIIGVVVVVVLAIAGYYLFSGGGSQPAGTTPGATNQPTSSVTPGEQPKFTLPAEVYSYIGDVKTVTADGLSMLAKANLNALEKDTTVTVKVDANTQIVRRSIPKTLPKEGGSNLFKQETIKLEDVKSGDQVTVVSAKNVSGVTSFTASRIEVLNIQ